MKIRRLCIAANNSTIIQYSKQDGKLWTYLFISSSDLQFPAKYLSLFQITQSCMLLFFYSSSFSTDAVSMHSKLQAAHVSAVPSVFFHKFSSIEFYVG